MRDYSYTSDVSSRQSLFFKELGHLNLSWNGNISSSQEVGRWPLFKSALDPRKQKEQIKNKKGEQILKGFLDPYSQSIVASDHLVEVIGKQLIEVCSLQLANLEPKIYLDVALREQLKELRTRAKAQPPTQDHKAERNVD